MEATKVNSIIEQLDESDGNGHRCNTNINKFTPLFESYDEEVTNTRKKSKKNPVILLSEYEDKDEKKEKITRITKKMKTIRKTRKR